MPLLIQAVYTIDRAQKNSRQSCLPINSSDIHLLSVSGMAPRTRASQQHSSGSDSDSDVPEAISLSQSKKEIQQLDIQRKNAELAERKSKRVLNREKDRQLKERAEKNKYAALATTDGKGKGRAEAEAEADDLEARMERAMAEANEESGEDDSDDEQAYEEFGGVKIGDEESGSDEDESEGSEDSDQDDSEDEDDSEEELEEAPPPKSTKIKFNPDHLPDELFAAAFAPKPKRKPEAELETEPTNPPAKKRKATGTKDIMVGCVVICIFLMMN